MKHLRSTPPVLVRLATAKENSENLNEMMRSRRKSHYKQGTYSVAYHGAIECYCSEPCVVLFTHPKLKGHVIHRVTVPNLIRTIVHESIHHALLWNFEELEDTFDNLFPLVEDMNYFA